MSEELNLPQVTKKDVSFGFRTKKIEGVEYKRPTVILPLEFPTAQGIYEIFKAGGKSLDLLIEAVEGVIIGAARSIVNDNEGMNAENFPYNQVTWEAIANQPVSDRRSQYSDEEFNFFKEDYLSIMPGVTQKSAEKVSYAVSLLEKKLLPVRTRDDVLRLLQEQLAIYAAQTPNLEETAPVVNSLNNRIEKFLKALDTSDPAELL